MLRVSEENGYPSPHYMLSYAGITHDEMFKPTIDHDRLGALLACSTEAIDFLRYSPVGEPAGMTLQLNGHRVPNGAVRWRRPALCPSCVAEKGYAEALWDFAYLPACPRHRIALVDRCGECRERLSWYRPALLQCRCGANLLKQPKFRVGRTIADFSNLISRAIAGHEIGGHPITSAFPDALSQMSLHTFVRLTVHLAQQVRRSLGLQRTHDPITQIRHVSALLNHWPRHFHTLLRRLGSQGDTESSGFRQQFMSFSNSIFRTVLPQDEVRFVKEALVQFGLHHWGKAVVSPLWARGVAEAGERGRFFSEHQLAKVSGIPPSLLASLRQHKLVRSSALKSRGRSILIDADGLGDAVNAAKSVVGQRRAAESLGLPEAVLRKLRSSGVYVARKSHKPDNYYRSDDIAVFRERLVTAARAVAHSDVPLEFVPLKAVVFRKCTPAPVRALIVAALVSGEFRGAVRSGTSTSEIWLDPDDLRDQLAGASAPDRKSRRGLTTWEAASVIGCNTFSVKPLAREGHFKLRQTRQGPEFDAQSVCHFAQRFKPMTTVARQFGIPSRRLRALCAKMAIQPIAALRRDRTAVQLFLPVRDTKRLAAALNETIYAPSVHSNQAA